MAKDYQIKISIDTSGAIKEIDGVSKALDNTGQSADNTEAKLKELSETLKSLDPDSAKYKAVADEFTKLGGKIEPVTQPVKSLKAQIRELQNDLLSGKIPQGTKQFDDMSKKLTELKDKAKDFQEEIGARTGSSVEQTSQGFALMKDRLMNLDFEGVSQATKGLATSIKSVGWKEFTGGIKESAQAFWGLVKAIMANPVVLILTSIALAGTAIYMAFKVAEKNVQESTDRMLQYIDRVATERKRQERIELASAQGNAQAVYEVKMKAMRAEKADNAKKILEILEQEKTGTKLTEEQFNILTEARRRNADIAVDIEVAKIERMNALTQAQFELDRKFNQVGLSERKKALDDLQNSFDDQEKKLIELGATKADLDKLDAVREDEIRKLRKTWDKEDKAKAKEKKDALIQILREQATEQIAVEEELTERIRQAKMSEKDIRIEAIRDEYFTLIETAKDLGMDYVALEKERDKKITQIQIEGANERKQLQMQIMQDRIAEEELYFQIGQDAGKSESELRLQALQEQYFLEKNMMEQYHQDTTDLTKKYEYEKTLIELQERQKRVDNQVYWANEGINLLTGLSELGEQKTEEGRKKAFRRNKALQIAQATADTYASANKAYLSQMSIPSPDAPIRASIAAGVAIAAGLVNVAKIAKTQYEGNSPSPSPSPSGGGGGGGGTGGGGFTETAQFNPLVTNFITNRPDQINPAYVLAGDVASAMEIRDKVENLARIN